MTGNFTHTVDIS